MRPGLVPNGAEGIKLFRSGNRELCMSRTLIILGLMIAAAGFLWPWIARLGLGRLPGDIVIQRGQTGFYFPVVTCLIVSVVVSVVFWLLRR